MAPISVAVGYALIIMDILGKIIDFLLYIRCLVNKEEYENEPIDIEFLEVCSQKTTFFIVHRMVAMPASIIFGVLAIVSLVSESSVYMIPWLVFVGVTELHDSFIYSYIGTQKAVSLNCLYLFQYSIIWTAMYYNYRKFMAVEKQYLEDQQERRRHRESIG